MNRLMGKWTPSNSCVQIEFSSWVIVVTPRARSRHVLRTKHTPAMGAAYVVLIKEQGKTAEIPRMVKNCNAFRDSVMGCIVKRFGLFSSFLWKKLSYRQCHRCISTVMIFILFFLVVVNLLRKQMRIKTWKNGLIFFMNYIVGYAIQLVVNVLLYFC